MLNNSTQTKYLPVSADVSSAQVSCIYSVTVVTCEVPFKKYR